METSDNKTINDLIFAYKNGQRYFEDWDFIEDDSAQGLDLSGITFVRCFMFLDFTNANLSGAKFISCNLKTADFSNANLKDITIKGCCVESTRFKGADIRNIIFENNGYYGLTLGQDDFIKLLNNE